MSSKTDSSTTTTTSTPVNEGDHVFLIDGSGYIFRAFHALPPLTRPSDGLPVGAVHGFCQMLWKLLMDLEDDGKPTHLACIFDTKKNYRNEIYPEYKMNRPPPPDDLIPQFALIRDAVKAFNLPSIEMEGFEADDLIATYAKQAEEAGATVSIVSSDKDLMQLVNEKVTMFDTMKNRRISIDAVHDKFGVGPDRVVDVQALAGDSTDNVPGVPGIGIKTAALLINEYGDLDELLARAEEIKQNKRRENLIEFADQARISRDLVYLKNDVPVDNVLEEFGVRDPQAEQLLSFLSEMEFKTLTTRIADRLGAEVPESATKMAVPKVKAKSKDGKELTGPAKVAADTLAKIKSIPVKYEDYVCISTEVELSTWLDEARDIGYVAFDTETNSLDAMQAKLVGFSLCSTPGKACYVPLAHTSTPDGQFDLGDSDPIQIPLNKALALLQPILEDPSILIIGQNLKYDVQVMKTHDININNLDDTLLLSYALDAGRGEHGMDDLSERHLGHKPISFTSVAGKGKKQITFDQLPLSEAMKYAAEDADITLRLWKVLKPRLADEKVTTVYETLERPLVPILAEMERDGVLVDTSILKNLSNRFAEKMAVFEKEAHELAGSPFNVGSPKQLGDILFGLMDLPGGKKTKTGAWQTGSKVLENLAEKGHELPQKVLEWRGLSKLKNTYTDTLPNFIHPETGRVHTSYSMAATTTGRFASTEPNLQNIPVRTEEGREIRTAFIAKEGHKLVSADYSQIELRLLAHIADLEVLKKAFHDGLDIHAMTASEMFGEPIEGMDPSVRRKAKAINFGIIYGISAFGLANQLGISRREAADYIKMYFKRFPGIQAYMNTMKEQVHASEEVQTIFGRRIHYPDINSKSRAQRNFVERASINAPIQGSAADILRRAIIRMPNALKDAKLKARMLLQVHDELIFEVPEDEVEATIPVVTEVMENACFPALELSVPIKVDARAADNWDEAH